MNCLDYEIQLPDKESRMDQDEEWIMLVSDKSCEKIRLHDYKKFYSVPGLYEEVLYKRLKCSSPRVVCSMLLEEIEKSDEEAEKLRVLDFGAGNGMVGECLEEMIGCDTLVGVDIIDEALEATLRDRPGLYDDYYVMDLNQLDERGERQLKEWGFNALVTIAALGYDHIPTRAFVNAFNLLDDGAWVAFNIKDKFLSEEDDSGFKQTLDAMMGDSLSVLHRKCYCHRLSLSGEQLQYYAIVGRKSEEAFLA
jgi:predicted TPR repeat methyltransferase